MELRAEDIQSAAERLRGQTVHTPLIGDVMLRVPLSHEDDPEAEIIAGPRIKAECVQTGGSVDHRGAVHFLLRQLGSLKGLVITGEPYRLLACARAGHSLYRGADVLTDDRLLLRVEAHCSSRSQSQRNVQYLH